MMSNIAATADDAALPACNVRKSCRWFRQEGVAACRVCPEVITDTRESQEPVLL
jgi:hypothetical protein